MAPTYFACLLTEYTTCIPAKLGYLLFHRLLLHFPSMNLSAVDLPPWNIPSLIFAQGNVMTLQSMAPLPPVLGSLPVPSRPRAICDFSHSPLWYVIGVPDVPSIRFVTLSRQAPGRLPLGVPSIAWWSVLQAIGLPQAAVEWKVMALLWANVF